MNVTGYKCSEVVKQDGLVDIPASCFLRHTSKISPLEKLKLHRIKTQMKYAATHKKVFHIWWHPHNFGVDTEENLENLEEILRYYSYLKERYDFTSTNMKMLGATCCENCDVDN